MHVRSILVVAATSALFAGCGAGQSTLPSFAGSRAAMTSSTTGGGLPLAAGCSAPASSNTGPFNYNAGTVPANDPLWINAVAAVKGISTTQRTRIVFRDVTYTTILNDGTTLTTALPNAELDFDPSATRPSLTYGTAGWKGTFPAAGGGNVFLDGAAITQPSSYQPRSGSISGTFCTDQPGVSLQWKFGAALYGPGLQTQYGNDGITPVDGYVNGYHAGTPVNALSSFIGGAGSGGGGSNYTGSYSGTTSVSLSAGTIADLCSAQTPGSNLFVGYASRVDVYRLPLSGSACKLRSLQLNTSVASGIAVAGNALHVLLRSTTFSTTIQTYDATATGPVLPSSTTSVRTDGSGGLAYASGIPALMTTGSRSAGAVTQAVPPPGLFTGSYLQQRAFTSVNGPIAVGMDGTAYEGAGSGAYVYAPTAADFSAYPDPRFVPARPSVTLGDTSAAASARGIALAPDGTLYVASVQSANVQLGQVAVYSPGAVTGTLPAYTIGVAAPTAIAVNPIGDLLVMHGGSIDVYAPAATTPSQTITVDPTTIGPSALAPTPSS